MRLARSVACGSKRESDRIGRSTTCILPYAEPSAADGIAKHAAEVAVMNAKCRPRAETDRRRHSIVVSASSTDAASSEAGADCTRAAGARAAPPTTSYRSGSQEGTPMRTRTDARIFGLAIAVAAVATTGCQQLGPSSLAAGRGAYNEVIARTGSEQTLDLIVRMRYADPIGLLTVSSVTANMQFEAKAEGQAGIGPESGYAGNLVPFSGGITYEDNPTISYTPVDGEAFLGGWLTPVPLDVLALALQTGGATRTRLALLVHDMNGLRSGRSARPSQRTDFARAALLLAELQKLDVATWVQKPGPPAGYALLLSDYAPDHTADVAELLQLFGLKRDLRRGAALEIPLLLGVRMPGFDGLAVATRSIAEILIDAGWDVEVPDAHVKAGIVAASEPMPADGRPILHVHSSKKAPKGANLAIRHRGWWFYIDDADLPTKHLFGDIQMLFLSRLSDVSRAQPSPVLTIPVR
jgi:hypothetical protein